jgi:hypothetical protein
VGLPRDLRIGAVDSENHELLTGRYTSKYQPDGSQLVRLDSLLLAGNEVRLETRRGAEGPAIR